MELACISLENTIEEIFYIYHQDAEKVIGKKKININSFLSIARQ